MTRSGADRAATARAPEARRRAPQLRALGGRGAAALREHGAEASLEEIARRAGVGIGTLYRHFPTRAT